MDNLLKLAPCSPRDLGKPLADLLSGGRVARLDGGAPYWIVAGRLEKRAMMHHGAPFGQVWTMAELESVGIELTLVGVLQALGRVSPGIS